MSEAAATASPSKPQSEQSPMILSVLPMLILFGAAVALLWLSTEDLAGTFKYWEIFVPTAAVLSLFSGWSQAQTMGNSRFWYVVRQFIHWGAVIGILYLFNAVGFRELLDDQQYTVILIGMLALAMLLAAIQMDYKLVFFALFLAFCAYVIFLPADNPAVAAVGDVFRITDPSTKPIVVSSVLAAVGFVAGLLVLYSVRGTGRKPAPRAAKAGPESGAA